MRNQYVFLAVFSHSPWHSRGNVSSTGRVQIAPRWQMTGIQIRTAGLSWLVCTINRDTLWGMNEQKGQSSEHNDTMDYPSCVYTPCNTMYVIRADVVRAKVSDFELKYMFCSFRLLLFLLPHHTHLHFSKSALLAFSFHVPMDTNSCSTIEVRAAP